MTSVTSFLSCGTVTVVLFPVIFITLVRFCMALSSQSTSGSQPLAGFPQLCLFWCGHINAVIPHALFRSGFLQVSWHFFEDRFIFILTLFSSGTPGTGQRVLTLCLPGIAAQTSAGPKEPSDTDLPFGSFTGWLNESNFAWHFLLLIIKFPHTHSVAGTIGIGAAFIRGALCTNPWGMEFTLQPTFLTGNYTRCLHEAPGIFSNRVPRKGSGNLKAFSRWGCPSVRLTCSSWGRVTITGLAAAQPAELL